MKSYILKVKSVLDEDVIIKFTFESNKKYSKKLLNDISNYLEIAVKEIDNDESIKTADEEKKLINFFLEGILNDGWNWKIRIYINVYSYFI